MRRCYLPGERELQYWASWLGKCSLGWSGGWNHSLHVILQWSFENLLSGPAACWSWKVKKVKECLPLELCQVKAQAEALPCPLKSEGEDPWFLICIGNFRRSNVIYVINQSHCVSSEHRRKTSAQLTSLDSCGVIVSEIKDSRYVSTSRCAV